ncbi:MAG TPA: hypothetical protein DCQ04_14025 [Actinobacteria bacterium]|nr:hypothetical protein [Actinomycetota bacterium]
MDSISADHLDTAAASAPVRASEHQSANEFVLPRVTTGTAIWIVNCSHRSLQPSSDQLLGRKRILLTSLEPPAQLSGPRRGHSWLIN